MHRFIAYAALAGLAVTSVARATEIETFDSPNTLAKAGGNYFLNRDTASFAAASAVQTFHSTSYELSTQGGYGSGYHDIYGLNNPPPGGTNGVIDASGNAYLQLDITVNNNTDAGLFIDLIDGEGDFRQWFFGFGLSGNAANDNADPAGHQFSPGEIVTQGGPNEEILDVPFTSVHNASSLTFDLSQLVIYRIENDPVATGGIGNPSDISYNDLSAVNLPEPTSLAGIAAGALLIGRRRRR